MSNKLMAQIMKLSVKERRALAQEIYDTVGDYPSPEELRAEVEREAARQRREPQSMLPGQAAELKRLIKKYDSHPELLIPKERVLAKLRRQK
jgi:hypothetical protein